MPLATMSAMLNISSAIVPQTDVTYAAFRLAFFETRERIVLAQQVGTMGDACFGYLTEVPFLKQVAPQVQLELLLETWQKHFSAEPTPASLVDESVFYAVCETATRLTEFDPALARRFLKKGPAEQIPRVDRDLRDGLRNLQQSMPSPGDFLLISQFLDMPPDEARELKQEFRLRVAACEEMFDVLGRWNVSPGFWENGTGLLTARETAQSAAILGVKRP